MTYRARMAFALLFVALVAAAGCTGPSLPPIAGFTACPDGARGGLEMQFSSTSQSVEGQWIVFFEWDFGDGTKTDDYYGWVTHRYAEAGTYAVSLTVKDSRGARATTAQDVEVRPVAEVRNVKLSPGSPPSAVGEFANLSPYFLYSASVKVKFYDADGVRIGEAIVDIQSIDPGERVRFVATAPDRLGAAFSASAFIQSFVPACAQGPVPVPEPVPTPDQG